LKLPASEDFHMTSRFPEPWRIAEFPNGFAVYDAADRHLGSVTLHDYTPYEREVLHLLASIRWACWLMATAVAGGAVPFVILALLGF
jgi:hypothetical protein